MDEEQFAQRLAEAVLRDPSIRTDVLGPVHVYLCHLARGSLRVAAGDVVVPGQPIGLVGDSGRSTEPHLHLHGIRPGADPVPVPVLLTVNGRQLWRGRLSPAA